MQTQKAKTSQKPQKCFPRLLSSLDSFQDQEKPHIFYTPSSCDTISSRTTMAAKRNNNSSSFSPCLIGGGSGGGDGEYIGIESCLDLTKDNEDVFGSCSSNDGVWSESRIGNRDERWRMVMINKKTKDKEFPPPIPLLARTENLPPHMPWVLKRYYTNDGRLILREEKVRHHEYFLAHRCNGRLTLQLVVPLHHHVLSALPFDDSADSNEGGEPEEEEEEIEGHDIDVNVGTERDEHCSKEVDGSDDNEIVMDEGDGYEDQRVPSMEMGKCLNYNSVNGPISTCIFGVPVVPAMRPVQS